MSFSSIISFMYSGMQEFERREYGVIFTSTPMRIISIFQIILTIIFIIIGLPPIYLPDATLTLSFGYTYIIVDYISKISLGVTVILFLAGLILGIKTKETPKSLWGLLFTVLLLGLEFYRQYFANEATVISAVLIAAGFIFILLALISYWKAGEFVE